MPAQDFPLIIEEVRPITVPPRPAAIALQMPILELTARMTAASTAYSAKKKELKSEGKTVTDWKVGRDTFEAKLKELWANRNPDGLLKLNSTLTDDFAKAFQPGGNMHSLLPAGEGFNAITDAGGYIPTLLKPAATEISAIQSFNEQSKRVIAQNNENARLRAEASAEVARRKAALQQIFAYLAKAESSNDSPASILVDMRALPNFPMPTEAAHLSPDVFKEIVNEWFVKSIERVLAEALELIKAELALQGNTAQAVYGLPEAQVQQLRAMPDALTIKYCAAVKAIKEASQRAQELQQQQEQQQALHNANEAYLSLADAEHVAKRFTTVQATVPRTSIGEVVHHEQPGPVVEQHHAQPHSNTHDEPDPYADVDYESVYKRNQAAKLAAGIAADKQEASPFASDHASVSATSNAFDSLLGKFEVQGAKTGDDVRATAPAFAAYSGKNASTGKATNSVSNDVDVDQLLKKFGGGDDEAPAQQAPQPLQKQTARQKTADDIFASSANAVDQFAPRPVIHVEERDLFGSTGAATNPNFNAALARFGVHDEDANPVVSRSRAGETNLFGNDEDEAAKKAAEKNGSPSAGSETVTSATTNAVAKYSAVSQQNSPKNLEQFITDNNKLTSEQLIKDFCEAIKLPLSDDQKKYLQEKLDIAAVTQSDQPFWRLQKTINKAVAIRKGMLEAIYNLTIREINANTTGTRDQVVGQEYAKLQKKLAENTGFGKATTGAKLFAAVKDNGEITYLPGADLSASGLHGKFKNPLNGSTGETSSPIKTVKEFIDFLAPYASEMGLDQNQHSYLLQKLLQAGQSDKHFTKAQKIITALETKDQSLLAQAVDINTGLGFGETTGTKIWRKRSNYS